MTAQAQPPQGLQDFNEGFEDGWHGRRRQKNRGATYLRAFKKGAASKQRQENGGEDLGDTPVARPRLRKTAVAKVA